MKDKTLTDILLICKGWYNKQLYKNELEALNAYYHKYYGCEDITMDKGFAISLFLKPVVLKAIEIKPRLAIYIFESISNVFDEKTSYEEVMYKRLMRLILMIESGTFDLSEYTEMFEMERNCNCTDKTIGII